MLSEKKARQCMWAKSIDVFRDFFGMSKMVGDHLAGYVLAVARRWWGEAKCNPNAIHREQLQISEVGFISGWS